MRRCVLLILDGFGVAPKTMANPRSEAKTPTLDHLEKSSLVATLQASGVAVGLPWGEPGNSEAGHLTIGAGRLFYHHLPRIVMAIQNGSFFHNQAFQQAFAHVRRTGGRLHVMGLVSSGSVHAYPDHLYALLEMVRKEGLSIMLHVFTDGRDAEPYEALKFLPQVEERMRVLGVGRIVSVVGRHFAMDRDGNWKRTEKAYRLLTQRKGERYMTLKEALQHFSSTGISDEFIPPTCVGDDRDTRVGPKDALLFLNFREDSARQISEAFAARNFSAFSRTDLRDFLFVTMTSYERGLNALVAFPAQDIGETFGETISRAGLTQLRIAETEKYAHVTYFLNGGIEEPFPGEERRLIHSRSDATADMAPEMRAAEIAAAICEAVEKHTHDVIVANFANADMVGHTGNFSACVRALEFLDQAVARVLECAEHAHVPLFIVADHGNVEEKRDLVSGRPLTEHSLNPVPFFAIIPEVHDAISEKTPIDRQQPSGLLIDVTPTILEVLDVKKPRSMTGKNLFFGIQGKR